jgi:hypothetical protein
VKTLTSENTLMKVHIFVATTQGLVAIQNITAIDDAEISSIVSINGTSTMANISSAYHNFVKKGAGLIQQDFGACSYRINISKRIDQGSSWQLAFYLAHAAERENMLGDGQVKLGDKVICATGEINTSSKEIQRISQLSLKQKLAAKQIKQWHKQHLDVSFLVPYANAQDIDKQLPLNIKRVRNLTQALAHLPLTEIANRMQSEVTAESLIPIDAALNTAAKSSRWFNKKSRWLIVTVTLLSIIILLLLTSMGISTGSFSANQKAVGSPSKKTLAQANEQVDNPQINGQQTWQIIVLNKALSKASAEINENLQPAYALVEQTITEQLIANNFDVADKTLITDTRSSTEQTLLPLNTLNAQLSKHGVNLAIRFHLTVNKLDKLAKRAEASTETWRYELSAYLIDLATKRKVDTHTEYGEYSREFINCDKQCFMHWLATNARKLAQDMGAILTIKLQSLPRRYQYELSFEDFLAKELLLINTQLKELGGFLSSDLLQEFATNKVLLHQTSSRKYLYTSYLPNDELIHHLDNIFEQLGLSVTKDMAREIAKERPRNDKGNANGLVFTRDNIPYFFHYLVSLVLLTSLCAFFFIVQYRRHQQDDCRDNYQDKQISEFAHHHESTNQSAHESIHEDIHKNTPPIKGAVIGQGALENCYIFTSSPLALGRLLDDATRSFAINYQQISRVGKQCLFHYENKQFYLEEQGSTNGSILNDSPLPVQEKIAITQDSTLLLGGANKGDLGLCQLSLTISKPGASALIMQLNNKLHQFIDLTKVKCEWPTMANDLNSRWILLAEEVSLSLDHGKIVFGCDKNETLAYLCYQDGFYIRPNILTKTANTHTKNTNSINKETRDGVSLVMINQETIHQIMPITENAVVSLNGYAFSLQAF